MFNRSINEECGVFGVYNCERASELTYFGLQSLQHRGQEGCGIVTADKVLHSHKGEGLVSKVFDRTNVAKLTGNHAIGHVRYSTTGESQLLNVQPFIFHSYNEDFGLCHNGNIVNADELRLELEQKGTIFQTTSDSEIIAHLLKRETGTFTERLQKALPKLVGAFAFLFIFEDEMYAALDPNGLRPLSLAKLDDGYIVSSETCGFTLVDARFERDIMPGEIIKINKDGITSATFGEKIQNKMCAMEYIYFSRPDSYLREESVYRVREQTGKYLAKQSDVQADVVIGVPDSGLPAARGYAKEAGIIYEQGLLKNKYSGRTFIQPTNELRKLGIKLKLTVVEELVRDKHVVVIDDSIVRGFTMQKIVDMLWQAGAKSVHVKIASPAIVKPCFYGVDFSTEAELISNKMDCNQLAEFIHATSVDFLSVDNLQKACNTDETKGLCLACFTGKYPTKLYKDTDSANTVIK
ncbi:amidophosphoribosyltransferase [Mollicutes bacterium LVI A0078]|nr:amidophosphoribosyltransferase [Mollicutes bacterium LVI A0075]WOO91524.1 amidophosphoribosyltransferase [Mollicutes bacterium LVI A0078]